MTKNTDIDKYKYFGYGIGFERHGLFLHLSDETGINAGADPEILKRVGALCSAPWLSNEENVRFQMA